MTALFALLVALAAPAFAADHANLEEGLPVQVEDAYPIAFRGREIQGVFRYERRDERDDPKDEYRLQPRLELGPAPNLELTLDAPFILGSVDKTGSRNLTAEALYNFNQESIVLPAFSLVAGAEFPSGRNSAGVDPRVKGILTKTLGRSLRMHRLHLNGVWLHEAGRRDDERSDRWRAIVGYSVRAWPDGVLVADFVREEGRREDEEANVFEVGLRIQITPLTVVVIGAGAGVGDESPDARATAGFQHSLALASWR
jgi:hypothetical protein